ncbi:hypothetical protein B0H14DRAFT_2585787 [Mycena olivaceomarginata]|nr:hypothetical protein B0H14DRAFT_2585787 [Mycena olivaceomarginata]
MPKGIQQSAVGPHQYSSRDDRSRTYAEVEIALIEVEVELVVMKIRGSHRTAAAILSRASASSLQFTYTVVTLPSYPTPTYTYIHASLAAPPGKQLDAFPPLKSAVGGVLALWNTAERVKTSKKKAQALSRRAYEVLEALTDAVPDPLNIPPSMLVSIQRFDDVVREARDAMDPLTERRRFVSSVLSLNRDEATLELFSRRLDESFQTVTIAGLTQMQIQLLEIKADVTVAHQSLSVAHQALTNLRLFMLYPGEVWPRNVYVAPQNEIDAMRSLYPGGDVHREPLGDQFDINLQINLWSVWAG